MRFVERDRTDPFEVDRTVCLKAEHQDGEDELRDAQGKHEVESHVDGGLSRTFCVRRSNLVEWSKSVCYT